MSENEISEEDFFAKWKEACNGGIEKLLIENWNKAPIYSFLILGEKGIKRNIFDAIGRDIKDLYGKKSVVEKIKESLGPGFDLHQEYYSADVVYYRKENNISEKSVWLNHIDIHLEHENVIEKSLEEIAQLQTLPGDLNVLVTYPNWGNDSDKVKNLLKDYADKINKKFDKKLLVVFGFLEDGNKSIYWEGHKFNQGEFIEIS